MRPLITLFAVLLLSTIAQAQAISSTTFKPISGFNSCVYTNHSGWSDGDLVCTTPSWYSSWIAERGVDYEIAGVVQNTNVFVTRTVQHFSFEWTTSAGTHPCINYGCTAAVCAIREGSYGPPQAWCQEVTPQPVPGQSNKMRVTNDWGLGGIKFYQDPYKLRWVLSYTILGSGPLGVSNIDWTLKLQMW